MFWIFAAVTFGIGLLAWVSSVLESRRARSPFDDAEPMRIVDARAGALVQVVGEVRVLGAEQRAPISDRPCAMLRVRVDGSRSSHASAPAELLEVLVRWSDVEVHDATGAVRLDTSALHVELDADRHEAREYITNLVGATPQGLAAYLAERALGERVDEHGERWVHLRVREWRLDPGARVAVLGVIEPGEGGAYRTAPVLRAHRLRLLG